MSPFCLSQRYLWVCFRGLSLHSLRVYVPKYESGVTEGLCSELEVSQLLKHVPKFASEGVCVHGVRSLKSAKSTLQVLNLKYLWIDLLANIPVFYYCEVACFLVIMKSV